MWRGADLRLSERPVAIKRALSGGDAVAAAKVRREAEVLASVNHPNVVTVYDAVEEDGDWWIVMEFVNGRTLAQTGTVAAEEAARYGAQLAGGLEAVHAKGILHRDIKPANVMVTDQGHAKLADFGIARQVHAEPTLTGTGAVTGTPGYVAPEVVKGAKFTQASDVFSLGATLFHLVEGTSPFGEGNAHSLLWRTAQGDRVEPKRAGVLAPVLDHLLQIDPKRRIKVHEARVALAKLSGEPTSGVRRKVGRRQWIWVGATAAVLVVAAAAALWLPGLRSSDAEGPQGDPPSLDPWDVVGNQATADPCSLFDETALGVYGETDIDSDNGSFESCDLRIENDTGGVDLNLYLYETNGDPHQKGRASMIGDFGVIRSEGEHEKCKRTLVFPDGEHFVEMYAKQDPGEDSDLCPIIDTAVNGALAILADGPMPRRDHEEDLESLYYMNACEILDDQALERFPGVNADHPIEGYADWTCQWVSTTSNITVRFLFDRDDPPEADDGDRIELDGRIGYIEGDHWGDNSCLVSIIYRSFPSAEEDGTITAENLRVLVNGTESDPPGELCDLAVSLAEPAAEALPEVD